jgi:hypothetical protein
MQPTIMEGNSGFGKNLSTPAIFASSSNHAPFRGRYHDDDGGVVRSARLYPAGKLYAVHAGHSPVHKIDAIGTLPLHERARFLAAGSHIARDTETPRDLREIFQYHRIVVHHQHAEILPVRAGPQEALPRLRPLFRSYGKNEGRPFAEFGFYPDPPAHHFDDPFGYGKTEPCPAELARRAVLGLLKSGEQAGLLLRRNTPTPVSVTAIWMTQTPSSSASMRASRLMEPRSGVKFTAFESRL